MEVGGGEELRPPGRIGVAVLAIGQVLVHDRLASKLIPLTSNHVADSMIGNLVQAGAIQGGCIVIRRPPGRGLPLQY
jgi:hypothetical protein